MRQGEDEHMNLDDFILPASVGSPAGVSPALLAMTTEAEFPTTTVAASNPGLPIKQLQKLQAEELSLARASAPSVPPLEQKRTNNEFNYVQRHVRKTSIDERRVCNMVQ